MAADPGAIAATPFRAGVAAALAALALAAVAVAPATAAGPAPAKPTFAISPVGSTGALLVHSDPGGMHRGEVRVRNVADHPVTVVLHAADVRTASNGNADYVTRRLTKTGRWLTLGASRVELAPHSSRRVAFTVRVPDATHGPSHYAGIVAVDASELAHATAGRATRRRRFTFSRVNRQALPLTVRLPGALSRGLALRSVRLNVQPVGAGLAIGLMPGGTELIEGATIRVRVLRDGRVVFTHTAALGQLFPGSLLRYRIPWKGRPTRGSYQVRGVVRPRDAAAVKIDETVDFTPAKATELEHEATVEPAQTGGLPLWVWVALVVAATALILLALAVWKLARASRAPVA